MNSSGPAARSLHEALSALQQSNMPQAGRAALQALEAFLAVDDPTGAAAAHQVLAMVAASRDDYGGAAAHVESAIGLRERTGDVEGVASLHQEMFELCLRAGDLPGARRALEAQKGAHERAGDREGVAHTLHQLAQVLLQSGEVAEAENYVQEAIFSMQGPQGARARSALQLLYANIWVKRGDPERAMRHAHEGLELARSARFRPGEIDALQEIGTLYAAMGEWDLSRRTLLEALNGRELLKDLDGKAHVLREIAGVEFATGNIDLAFEHLDYAVRTVRETGNLIGEITLLQLVQSSAEEYEQPEIALKAALDLVKAAEALQDPESIAAAVVGLAQRYASIGNLPAARAGFERANLIQQELGLVEESAVSEGMLGQIVVAMGDVAEGRAMLEHSLEALRRLGSDAADMVAEILAELEA